MDVAQVRAGSLQELVYKQGQAGVTKASVSIVFNNLDKTNSPVGYEQHDQITVTRQVSPLLSPPSPVFSPHALTAKVPVKLGSVHCDSALKRTHRRSAAGDRGTEQVPYQWPRGAAQVISPS